MSVPPADKTAVNHGEQRESYGKLATGIAAVLQRWWPSGWEAFGIRGLALSVSGA